MCQQAYRDDLEITDETRLFRRVHPTQLVRDDDTGFSRVSSGVFRDQELSIDIESVLVLHNETAEYCLRNYPDHKLVSLMARDGRNHQQSVCHDPQFDNPSHGLIYGTKTGRIRDSLRDAALWVIPPLAPTHGA